MLNSDNHIKEGYLFKITLHHEHNHPLESAEAFRYRPVSEETIEKLKSLFQNGHSPSSALDTIKYDLQEQHGENYLYAAADRSVCPESDFCYRLDVTIKYPRTCTVLYFRVVL